MSAGASPVVPAPAGAEVVEAGEWLRYAVIIAAGLVVLYIIVRATSKESAAAAVKE